MESAQSENRQHDERRAIGAGDFHGVPGSAYKISVKTYRARRKINLAIGLRCTSLTGIRCKFRSCSTHSYRMES